VSVHRERQARSRSRTPGTPFEKLVALQAQLRSPRGCPWDRQQTHQSLRTYLLEETYEVLEALDSGDAQKFADELGDLLLQVVFHAELAREAGRFDIRDVIERIHAKLVRRHPHVFGKVRAKTAAQVLKNWEQLKAEERGAEAAVSDAKAEASLLEGLPRTLPALLEAYQLTRRAARVGFDWDNIEGLLEKLREETAELCEALGRADREHREEEVGDLLFVAVNVARFLGIDPEIALKKANQKFTARFKQMEQQAARQGRPLAEASKDDQENLWEASKARPGGVAMKWEASPASGPEPASAQIQVRPCHSLEEFQVCVGLQKLVWAGADIDVVPLPLFVVAAETGGQVLGAFSGAAEPKHMVGFTIALAGVRGGQAYLHSHMTAVLEGYRDRGVGRQLKLYQRQEALARGIELVEWTFDPLEIKNAYFNLMRLGAIARRLLPNCYGITTSPLHAEMPTDRLMAEWWLRSPRVEEAVGARHAAPLQPNAVASVVRIHVPADMDEMRQTDRVRALRVQTEIREQFQSWFARSYAATGLQRTAAGGDYLLEPWTG